MASISDLQKKIRLQSEVDAVERALAVVPFAKEGKALRRVLAKIKGELKDFVLNFPEAPETPLAPVLPDSSYREPMPSQRARRKNPWDEGAPGRIYRKKTKL